MRLVPCLTPSGHSCSFVRSNNRKSIEGQIRAPILKAAWTLLFLVGSGASPPFRPRAKQTVNARA